jgi:fermentation-respiration switch protein FrsA (DUF1100 family)
MNTVEEMTSKLTAGRNKITFKSQNANIAGFLYLPKDFSADKKYPTILFMRPATQVKEQTIKVYGNKFAAKGYVFMGFEPYNYGESDGDIKNYESTEHILLNISDAISFLRSFDFVDRDRLTGAGLCMGGMYMTYTAVMDKRLKAVATISAFLNNAGYLYSMMPKEQMLQVLEMQGEERQKYYGTGELKRADLLGGMFDNGLPEGLPKFFQDTYSYYFTERAGTKTYPGYTNMVPSFQPQADIRLNANGFAPYFNTPYLGIRGSVALTGPMTDEFYGNVTEPKEMHVIEEAGHFDLYDVDAYVDQVIEKAGNFFKKHTLV